MLIIKNVKFEMKNGSKINHQGTEEPRGAHPPSDAVRRALASNIYGSKYSRRWRHESHARRMCSPFTASQYEPKSTLANPKSTSPLPKSTVDPGCERLIWVEHTLTSPRFWDSRRAFCPITTRPCRRSNRTQAAAERKVFFAAVDLGCGGNVQNFNPLRTAVIDTPLQGTAREYARPTLHLCAFEPWWLRSLCSLRLCGKLRSSAALQSAKKTCRQSLFVAL
jgi:hypothetical protein